ncbi:MAG: rhodanese-like domain-containing protein [Magnetospirillum sp.]
MLNRLFGALSGNGKGNVHMVAPSTVAEWIAAGTAIVVDVREPGEYASEHIKDALNLPLSTFQASQIPEVPEGKKLVFHCRSGQRCGMAAAKAVQAGYQGEINRMEGGMIGWMSMGGAVIR